MLFRGISKSKRIYICCVDSPMQQVSLVEYLLSQEDCSSILLIGKTRVISSLARLNPRRIRVFSLEFLGYLFLCSLGGRLIKSSIDILVGDHRSFIGGLLLLSSHRSVSLRVLYDGLTTDVFRCSSDNWSTLKLFSWWYSPMRMAPKRCVERTYARISYSTCVNDTSHFESTGLSTYVDKNKGELRDKITLILGTGILRHPYEYLDKDQYLDILDNIRLKTLKKANSVLYVCHRNEDMELVSKYFRSPVQPVNGFESILEDLVGNVSEVIMLFPSTAIHACCKLSPVNGIYLLDLSPLMAGPNADRFAMLSKAMKGYDDCNLIQL